MMQVILSARGQDDFDALPRSIQKRVLAVLDRLAAWPAVSGVKPLRYEWAGCHRIRTGDYRIIFEVQDDVIVVHIAHRKDVYEG
ncbi:MAG: type II toxin-antitoxin system RelE family toxin [Planctomycetota bacterium]